MTAPRAGLRASLGRAARMFWSQAAAFRHRRLAVQVLGLLLSLALLAWCLSVAFKAENRANLEKILDAPPRVFAGLLALSAASLFVNGACFWITMRPAKRIRFVDMQAANAVASFLGYLPFKLSILARFAIHHTRDGVPILTIGAWIASNAATLLAALVPMCAASLLRGKIDAGWLGICIGGWLVTFAAMSVSARTFAGDAGLERLARLAAASRVGLFARAVRSPRFRHLHAGFDILAHRPTVAGAMSLRAFDLLLQAARFSLASGAIGMQLGPGRSVLAASTFFLIGVLSPAGAVGAREGGTTGLAAMARIEGLDHQSLAVVALTVSATEAVIVLAAAIVGAVWLRADRLLRPASP